MNSKHKRQKTAGVACIPQSLLKFEPRMKTPAESLNLFSCISDYSGLRSHLFT